MGKGGNEQEEKGGWERKRDGEIGRAVKKSLSGKQFPLSELYSNRAQTRLNQN